MQANFQLLTGVSAIGGGLQLPVTQCYAADNFVGCTSSFTNKKLTIKFKYIC